jgi:hypothetical protein
MGDRKHWCDNANCPLCAEFHRMIERRSEERRTLRGWRWLKHFLGIDQWLERRIVP